MIIWQVSCLLHFKLISHSREITEQVQFDHPDDIYLLHYRKKNCVEYLMWNFLKNAVLVHDNKQPSSWKCNKVELKVTEEDWMAVNREIVYNSQAIKETYRDMDLNKIDTWNHKWFSELQ